MANKIKNLETDLFKPVKAYFENLGYKVNAEVMHCDVTALKGDRLIIIELKKSFNMTVLYQAIDRQKISNEVYIAIPKPTRRLVKDFNKMLHIAECLNLGLLSVELKKSSSHVEVLCEPDGEGRKKNNKRSRRLLNEISERIMDNNCGGSTGEKIITAYTEKAIRIAVVLSLYGSMKASVLVKDYGCCPKTWNMLYDNHYGWFDRVGDSKYDLNEKGKQVLQSKKYVGHVAVIEEEIKRLEFYHAK